MDAQRERILRATLRCISELGIEQTSIAAIRREARLSAGALYTHFASKEAIIAAALRFGMMGDTHFPDEWVDLTAAIAGTEDQGEFDIAMIARTQLQVFASGIRPGPLHDLLKPLIEQSLAILVRHLADMARDGRVTLRMSPMRTALAIAAIRDGLLWTGLALERPFAEIEADIVAALDCLVSPTVRT